jgi:hypothetical protein
VNDNQSQNKTVMFLMKNKGCYALHINYLQLLQSEANQFCGEYGNGKCGESLIQVSESDRQHMAWPRTFPLVYPTLVLLDILFGNQCESQLPSYLIIERGMCYRTVLPRKSVLG